MFQVNDNFQKLPGSYLFSTIAKKVSAYPVSYTHLDVYKRQQVFRCLDLAMFCGKV